MNNIFCRVMRASILFNLLIILAIQSAYSQQIIPDGNTMTSVSQFGKTTNVLTETIKGENAFNSFSRFNVNITETVNLIIPSVVKNLVNVVHDEASDISGTLNTIQNNTIGGNLIFVNPHGLMVSNSGQINTGSFHFASPSHQFMSGFLNADGAINENFVNDLMQYNYDVNPDSVVTIEGQVNAISSITLHSGSVTNHGIINTGAEYDIKNQDLETLGVEDVVNLNAFNELVEITTKNGEIFILAENELIQDGVILADKVELNTFGDITTPDETYANILANTVNVSAFGNIDIKNVNISDSARLSSVNGFIYLKAALVKDLETKNNRGNLDIEAVSISGNADITNRRGDVKISNSFIEDLEINKRRGNVEVVQSHIGNNVYISNGSGKNEINQSFIENDLEIVAKGDVVLAYLNVVGETNVKTTKGIVEVSNSYLQNNINVENNSGDINVININFVKDAQLTANDGIVSVKNALIEGHLSIDNNGTETALMGLNVKNGTTINSAKGDVNVELASLESDLTVNAEEGNIKLENAAVIGSASLVDYKGDVLVKRTYVENDLYIDVNDGNSEIANTTVGGNASVKINVGDSLVNESLIYNDLDVTVENGVSDIVNSSILGEVKVSNGLPVVEVFVQIEEPSEESPEEPYSEQPDSEQPDNQENQENIELSTSENS